MPSSSTQGVSSRLIGLERLRLSPRPVQREHQLRPQALPQWMLGHEGLQLGDQLGVVTLGELLLDPLLDTGQPKLLQTDDLVLREAPVGEVGKRSPAPE